MDAESSEKFMNLNIRNSLVCLNYCIDPQTFLTSSKITTQ